MKEDGDEPVRPSRGQIEPKRISVCVYIIIQVPLPLLSVHQHSVHQNRPTIVVPVISSAFYTHDAELGPDL